MIAAESLIAQRFTLKRRLGTGGMGEVWAATDSDGSHCAIKLIRSDLTDPLLAQRFRREAALTSALQHDNIVKIIAHGDDGDGGLFVAMELLAGASLKSRLELGNPLPWRQACAMALDMARALAHAHGKGIVHRDIKPANVVLVLGAGVERAVLLDFGIARRLEHGATMTGSGEVVGTAGYIAPEVALGGQPFDARGDIFSLGVTLYEALAGAPPFVAANALALTIRYANEDPKPPGMREVGIPAAVSDLVMRMMARDPSRRPSGAAALESELAALLTDVAAEPHAVPAAVAPAAAGPWHSEYFIVSHDPVVGLVRVERTENEMRSAEEIGQVFSLLRSLFPAGVRAGLSLLIDVRRGPQRTDPRFEKIVISEIIDIYQMWRRAALLVATERGLEQVNMMRERSGIEGRAFRDEETALSWLLSG